MILFTRSSAAHRASGSRRSGLTLIEVLLALGIFLMAIVAIGSLVDMGTDREIEAQFQVRAARLAQSKMGEIVSGTLGGLSTLSAGSGTFDNDADWSWTMSATQQQSGVPNLYTVQITVTRDLKGRQFQYVLTQIAIDPYYMGNGQPATTTTSPGSATSALMGAGGGTP